MPEAYTIRIFVPDGDPEGVKIVDHLNWTGIGVAFPRSSWPVLRSRREFDRAGVYILTGAAEGSSDDLPTVYVGQGEKIRERLDKHAVEKDFWERGIAFVSNGSALNRAHITWLEHSLLAHAQEARRCHLDNASMPGEPMLSESEKADTERFLREIMRILPLVGVRVFERVQPVPTVRAAASPAAPPDPRDTIIIPAQEEGFRRVFLGESCWYSIRIAGGMISKIKYIAAYQTNPISAITHYAPVERIEPYGDDGKYKLIFSEPAQSIGPISFDDAPTGSMQGPRYTSLQRLRTSRKITDLFPRNTGSGG